MVSASQAVFVGLVVLVAAQRLIEVRHSRKNEARLRRRGAVEHAPHQMRWMRLLHGAWLVAMIVEVVALDRPFAWPLAVGALAVFGVGQALRLIAMRTLGERWTAKVLTLPHAPPVRGGIYRWIRHPNYVGVILEIAALPLVHGAWITAVAFSALNGLLLWRRIAVENAAVHGEGTPMRVAT